MAYVTGKNVSEVVASGKSQALPSLLTVEHPLGA